MPSRTTSGVLHFDGHGAPSCGSLVNADGQNLCIGRSEERRVGKEGTARGLPLQWMKCDDGQSARPSTVDQQTATATIRLEAGEVVRCVWFKQKAASTVDM